MSKRKRRHNNLKYPAPTHKICPRCKKDKPIDSFGAHKEYNIERHVIRTRVNSWCKECHLEYSKIRRRRPGYKLEAARYMREWNKKKKVEFSVIKQIQR